VKDYYQILKIKRTATDTEIKKAFRKLAIKYHPDKNPHSNTVELFQEINEAYETLGDANLKSGYDQQYDYFFGGASQRTATARPTYYYPPSPPRNRPSYYERARAQYAPKKFDYGPYVPFFKKVNLAGLMLCFLLLTDFILTQKFEDQEVVKMDNLRAVKELHLRSNSRQIGAKEEFSTINTQNFDFRMEVEKSIFVEEGDRMDVYFTPLFRIIRWVEFKNKPLSFAPHYGIYNSFLFIPAILLIISFLGVFVKKGEKHIVDMGVAALIFIILTTIFILVS